jgi:hypothetical protein
MRLVLGCLLAIATASTVSAQSAYVGVSFVGDVIRVSGTDGLGDGETFGAALRAGTPLGQGWGVELEFARTGPVETSPEVSILSADLRAFGVIPDLQSFPLPRIQVERQLTTVTALLWRSQELSDRLTLLYLGGVAFTRTHAEMEITYPALPPFVPMSPSPLLPIRGISQETVTYDADVAVGFEGRIRLTEHVRLTPGIRLHSAAGGWAIRPGIGLTWVF